MRNNNRMQTKQNHPYRAWQRVVSALACTVMLITSYGGMILPVKATEQTAYCGHEEHQHSQECYEKRLICGHEETTGEPHVHTAECYQQQRVLICGLEETPGHIHDESCVQKSEGLTCGKEETPPHAHTESCVKVDKIQTCTDESEDHVHSDGCYQTKETYICGKTAGEGGHTHGPECYGTVETYTCGKEAGEGGHTHGESCYETRDVLTCEIHVHTEACYEEVLVCDQEEHTHSLSCFSDPEADVESETVWENSVSGVALTGVWAEDVIAIAESQLGYTESERNYTVTGDGARKGYTRYGDWYGDPYGDWSAMFVSFCLYYAGISRQSVPYASDCAGWVGTLAGETWGLYRSMEGNSPQKGDIVFLDTDADGSADQAGLVASVSGGSLRIIVGDSDNSVRTVSCAMSSDSLLGFAALPENPSNLNAQTNDAALFALEGDDGAVLADGAGDLTITLERKLKVDVPANETVKIPFTPKYTHEYIFQSTGTGDTYGYIYDANDKQLAENDDGGGNQQFKITKKLNAGVTYYLGVKWRNNSKSGVIPVMLTYGKHSYTKNESGLYACSCGMLPHGTCGNGVTWHFADGTLTISGSGAMQNYSENNVPWKVLKNDITDIVVKDGVTIIGSHAFSGCSRLRELVWDAKDAAPTDSNTSKVSDFTLVIGKNVDNISAETFAAMLKMGAKEIQFAGPNALTLPDVQADVLGLPLSRLAAGDYYVDAQGVLYRIHGGAASLAYCPPELTQYTVPANVPDKGGNFVSVTGVDGYAFAAAQKLTAITFDKPDNITVLKDFAFANACSLESINGANNQEEVLAKFTGIRDAGVQLFENTRIVRLDNPTGEILNPTKEHVDLKISTAASTNRTPAMAEDNTFQYYTGETATTSVTISNPDSSEIAEGTIVRIIYKFDRAGGTLNYKTGAYTLKATNSENEYKMTISESTVPYCYVIDIERPRQGDTLSVNLGAAYPSPTSAGGNAMIWGGILTAEEVAAQGSTLIPPSGAYHRINWSTKPDTFPVSKSFNGSDPAVMKGDGNGGAYISGLSYGIGMSRGEGQTLEGIGKDYITSVDFRDVLTLPEGAVLSPELIKAVRNKSYTTNGWSSVDFGINGTKFLTLGYPDHYAPESRSLEIDENGNLVLNWTMKNKDLSTEIPNMSFTYSIYGQYVLIPEPQQGTNYTVNNQVTATQHYMHSEDQVQSANCPVNVAVSEGKLDFDKELVSDNLFGHFGDPDYLWRITASNPGVLPYEGLAYIEDELPDGLWLTGDQLAALFAADTEHQLTVTISRATLCTPHTSQPVTGIDGTSTGSTSLRNTGADTPYNGLASTDPDTRGETTIPITLGWGSDGNLLLRLGESEPKTCTVDGTAIQSALDGLGFLVTANTKYKLSWNLRDERGNPVPLVGGGSIVKEIPCSAKDTFMLLSQDQGICYPDSLYIGNDNYAYAYDNNREQLGSDDVHFYRSGEFSLTKGWSWNGQAVEPDSPIAQGDVVSYSLTVQHSGTGSYDVLPLTDHMTGGQALLVPKAKNQNADWAAGCRTITLEDAEYYLLTEPGTYSHVWTSDTQLADTVTVKKTDSGFDTLMKWYFTDYTGSCTDTVSYQAYVCPNLAVPGALSYSLGNESWLNDHATHRLYDVVGRWWGTTILFDKKIVESVGDTGAGAVHSYVHEGERVIYRLMLESGVDEEGNSLELRLTGDDMYDTLPLSIRSYRWSRENVHIFYQTETDDYQVVNRDSWYIETASGSDQQLLKWNADFSITFRGRAYIYVTLDFPREIPWQNYAARYSATTLVNTYHVLNAQASVTHELSIPAQVRLQKGVWNSNGYNTSDGDNLADYCWSSDCRLYYNNDDSRPRYVTYYVSLYNGGMTNLYLTDLQDRLPRGFTLSDCDSDSDFLSGYASVYRANEKTASYKYTSISSSTRTVNGIQYVTFHFSKGDSSAPSINIRYDESRGMCYLAPGEAIQFAYVCRTNQAADTDDAALNTISMPYYDYNGGGVQVDNDCKIVVKDSDKYTPNDGGCEVWNYSQAQTAGLTGGTTDTQWLTSQVTVSRGGIKPGITKTLTSKTDVNGNVTQNPAFAAPTDTLTWTVTAENDGTLAIKDYVLTDVMQAPYGFTGKVNYRIFASGRTDPIRYPRYGSLFEITSAGDGKLHISYQGSKTAELTVGGPPLTVPVSWAYENSTYPSSTLQEVQLSVRQDDAGNAVMSIRFPKEMAIPEYGKGVLTLSTKNETSILENKQFVNAAFITPLTQTWDDGTNKGNMTTLTTPFAEGELPSVRNSAPVTTTYGYMTSSSIRVTEADNPANTATSTADPNYIVLENTEKLFNYTLSVENTTPRAMDKLILISNLPQKGDHSSFLESDPRFSEFMVSLANSPNFTVTVKAKNGDVTTLDPNQYTIEFSDKTEFDANDWNGTSTWTSTSTDLTRSIRLKISDEAGTMIPEGSTVSLTFTCEIKGDAEPGATAWNSFGYHYRLKNESLDLEAAPLKVGVKVPSVPKLKKQIVDHQGKEMAIKETADFSFLVYQGTALTGNYDTEEALTAALNEGNIPFRKYTVSVHEGKSQSEPVSLEAEGWTWTKDQKYTVTELPCGEKYMFSSFGGSTGASYTFTYNPSQTQTISCNNAMQNWAVTLTKVNTSEEPLSGAVFALYSPVEKDRISEIPEAYQELNIEQTLQRDNKTWYLKAVDTTDEEGKLMFRELLREKYYLLEVKPPVGYKLSDLTGQLLEQKYEVQGVYEVTVVNRREIDLPKTGGIGIDMLYTLGGILLIQCAVIFLLTGRNGRAAKKKGRNQP